MIISKRKKSQSSVEFVLIAGVMFLVFIGMAMIIQGRVANAQRDRLYDGLEGLGRVVSTEVRLAHAAQGYYAREFFLPELVRGFNYSINIYDQSEIVINVDELSYVVFLDSNITGDIGKRRNLIMKNNTNITITHLG